MRKIGKEGDTNIMRFYIAFLMLFFELKREHQHWNKYTSPNYMDKQLHHINY